MIIIVKCRHVELNLFYLKITDLLDTRPEIIKIIVGQIHYLHFGCILFVITLVVTVVVTILTEPIEKDYVGYSITTSDRKFSTNNAIKCFCIFQLYRLTFWTRHSAKIRLELKDEEEESTAELVSNAANNPDTTDEEDGIIRTYIAYKVQ